MMYFYNLPIQTKFKQLIIGTISTVILVITLIFLIIIFRSYGIALDKRISIQQKIVIRAAQTAILFNDAKEMREILNSLNVDKDIVHGVIVLEDNPNYASYQITETKHTEYHWYEIFFPCSLMDEIKSYKISFKYGKDSLEDNLKTGWLILDVNLYHFYIDFIFSIVLSLFISSICLLVSIKFTGRIISRIINPILKLVKTAKKVAAEQDYTIRAEVFELDEVGILAQNLNDMMTQIQLRDDKLEETVRQRTEALKKALDEAKKANHAKTNFIANISHEIRTPMNAILNKNYFALQTELTRKQRDYLTVIESSSKLLLNIINDILDFSKIESGKFRLDKIDFALNELLDNLAMMFASEIEKKKLELILSYPLKLDAYIIGDDLRLSQILINLVGNAIKFTEKGEIIVLIKLIKETGRQVTLKFSIKDTGMGIPAENLPKLFNSFTQADASITRKHGGTGLGLAVSQKLANLMGGVIKVESQIEQGSHFFFTLTFNKSEKMPLNSLTTYKASIENLNILLLSSNQALQIAFDSMFSELNITLHKVIDLQSAITALDCANKVYDVFLIDWKSVKINEFFSQQIFEDFDKLIKTPTIIMATSLEQDQVIEKKYHLFAKYIVTKPIKTEELIDAVCVVVNNKSCIKTTNISFDNRQVLAENIGEAHILLVEDDLINQEIACELLEMQGLQISIANNGKEAVDMIAQQRFDLVLMDLQMPEMDGYQATTVIRQGFNKEELPIIAMTAHAMNDDRERCLTSGMNEHITKPIEPNVFYNVLVKYLHKLQPTREIEQKTDSSTIFPEVVGVDFQEGLSRCRENQNLYLKVLRMFIKEHGHSVEDIKQKLVDGNNKDARLKAHTLKGVAANLGAKALSVTAADIETQIEKHDKLQTEQSLVELGNDIVHFIEAIESISVDSENENKKVTTLFERETLALKQQLQELEKLVEISDFSANTKIQIILEQTIQTEAIYKDLKVIGEEISLFNFEKVSILIAILVKKL